MDEDLYQKLLDSAFRFVSYRPRGEKEIRDFLERKLKRRKVNDPQTLNSTVERLRQLGYIDDTKFVRWWIEQRNTFKPKGTRLLAQELRAKGIRRETITEMLVNSTTRETTALSEEDLARKALLKKLPLWKKLPSLELKKKIYGFLGRRGFSGATISRIIDEVRTKR